MLTTDPGISVDVGGLHQNGDVGPADDRVEHREDAL
jgi:hypothetical protein